MRAVRPPRPFTERVGVRASGAPDWGPPPVAPRTFRASSVVRRSGPGFRVDLVDGQPVNRHKPSVDVLFRSVAQAAGPHGAAAILTGMGDDGAEGLLEIRQAGGLTIAQDEATSTVFGMPREAIKRGAAKLVLPLDRISSALHPNGGQWAD